MSMMKHMGGTESSRMRGGLKIVGVLVLAAGFWISSYGVAKWANHERDTWPKTENVGFLPSPKFARLLSFGYNELSADLQWIRTLIYYGMSLSGDTDLTSLELFTDNVMTLDPYFKRPYRWAAYAVTYKNEKQATQEEFWTSVRYLKKGMAQFPDNYELFWLAGLRYWSDLRSDDPKVQEQYKEIGAAYIEEAIRKPDAPPDLAAFAASLQTRIGQREQAMTNLKEKIMTVKDEDARFALLNRLGLIAEDPELAAEVTRARDAFDDTWRQYPFLPEDFMVLLGPKSQGNIDFRRLATDRNLFGADDPNQLWH